MATAVDHAASKSEPDTSTPPASWEDWVHRFVPITNPDGNESWGGFLFETHGTEYYRVRDAARAQPGTVWTLLDCDGQFVIADGMHMVNRFGYFITERAYTGTACDFVDEDDDDDERDQERAEEDAEQEYEWQALRSDESSSPQFDVPNDQAPFDDDPGIGPEGERT